MRYRRRKSVTFSTNTILLICLGSIAFLGFSFLSQLNLLENTDVVLLVIIFLFLSGFVLLGAKILIRKIQTTRFKNISFSSIENMSGIEFEEYVAYLYRARGYRVHTTAISGDMGVDLIAERNHERLAIQVKRYKKSVGRSAISDAVAGMAQYKCNSCAVVTNSHFTKLARQLAYINRCTLIDRDSLGRMIIEANQKN